MKRIVTVSLFARALGGCIHEAALDRHLYDRTGNLSGPMVPPLGPRAAVLVPPGDPAPPMRDPTVTETGVPVAGATSTAPAIPAAPPAPATPASPS